MGKSANLCPPHIGPGGGVIVDVSYEWSLGPNYSTSHAYPPYRLLHGRCAQFPGVGEVGHEGKMAARLNHLLKQPVTRKALIRFLLAILQTFVSHILAQVVASLLMCLEVDIKIVRQQLQPFAKRTLPRTGMFWDVFKLDKINYHFVNIIIEIYLKNIL